MWKAACLTFFLVGALPLDSRAQSQPLAPTESVETSSAAVDASITSAMTGMSYVIAEKSGVRTANTTGEAPAAALALDTLTPAQRGILEKLNRVNASRLSRLSRVVMPAEWSDDELAYSPFPQRYEWAADKAKAIVVDQSAQAFAAYEHGQLVRWGPVSTGENGKTPAGVFSLSWRSRGHRSSVDPSWYLEWYWNFIPARGIAFHKYALPGRAGSHGCVRMLERDAQWLYGWGEAKAAVVVLGCPDGDKAWQQEDFLRQGIALPADPDKTMRECSGPGAANASHRRTLR